MIPPRLKFDVRGLLTAISQDTETGAILSSGLLDRAALARTLETGFVHYFNPKKNRIWKKGEKNGRMQEVVRVYIDCDQDALLFAVRQHGQVACHTGRYTCFYREVLQEGEKAHYEEKINEDPFFPAQLFSPAAPDAPTLNAKTPVVTTPRAHQTPTPGRSAVAPEEARADGPFDARVLNRVLQVIGERIGYPQQRSYVRVLFEKGLPRITRKFMEEAEGFGDAIQHREGDEVVYKTADLLFHVWVALAARGVDPALVYAELGKRFGAPEQTHEEKKL